VLLSIFISQFAGGNTISMDIGLAIKTVRKKLGIQQKDLAQSCNLSQTSISQIENSLKKPSPKNLERLCQALGIPEPMIYIIALQETDIPYNKKEAYKVLHSSMVDLILQLVNTNGGHS